MMASSFVRLNEVGLVESFCDRRAGRDVQVIVYHDLLLPFADLLFAIGTEASLVESIEATSRNL